MDRTTLYEMGALGVTADKVAMDGLLDAARRAAFSQQHLELSYNAQGKTANVTTHTVDGRSVTDTQVKFVDDDPSWSGVGYRASANGATTIAQFEMDKRFNYRFPGGTQLQGKCSSTNGWTVCDGKLTSVSQSFNMHSESNLQTGMLGEPSNPNRYVTYTTYSSPAIRGSVTIAETVQINGDRLTANIYKNPSDPMLADIRRNWGHR